MSFQLHTGEAAELVVGSLERTDLSGRFVEKTCYLRPAIVTYHVSIENNIVTIPRDTPNQGEVVALANNTKVPERGNPDPNVGQGSTLWRPITVDAITVDALFIAQANASMEWSNQGAWVISGITENSEAQRYFRSDPDHRNIFHFVDPTPDIIYMYNELMFRGAVKAAKWTNITQSQLDPGISIEQKVPAQIVQLIFRSDLRWFAGAAVIELAAIILILPMFFGFWAIGGDLTLSPLNIALAFDSPLLKDVNSAGGAKGVVRELGGLKVKFGVVEPGERLEAPDEGYEKTKYANGRLGFGSEQGIVTPRKGTKFLE